MLGISSFRRPSLPGPACTTTASAHAPMPIIMGAPRPGTTLLRLMLNTDPSLAIPPETGFLAVPPKWTKLTATRAGLFRFVTNFLSRPERAGLRSIGKLLPEAHFIHLIRDGRDVALSLRTMWFAPGQDMRTLALYWRRLVQSAREAGRDSWAYMEICCEDLIEDPQFTVHSVCGFLGLEFDPAMLRYWKRATERLQEHGPRRRMDGRLVVSHEQTLSQQRLTPQPPRADRISAGKEK